MRWIAVTPLLALLALPTAAEESLTLRAAIDTALSNSAVVQAASERAEAAAARARQAKGFRLPAVDLTEMVNRTDNPAEVFAFLLNQERFDMSAFFAADPNQPDPLTTWMTRLEVTQPLYTGGKLSARIDQAELAARAAKLELDHAREQVSYDAVTAVVGLARAREYLSVLQKARQTTIAHVELVNAYADQGMVVRAELLKAQVFLAEMDELVTQAETGARLGEAALAFHLGLDQDRAFELAPLVAAPAVGTTLDSFLAAAVDARRDLAAARNQVAAGQLEERVARSSLLPEVAAVGRYDLYDDTALGSNGSSGALMAVARINLYRGGADRAAQVAARHETAAHQAGLGHFEDGVRLEVRQAWQELETGRRRQQTAAASLAAAREALRVTEERFRQGLEKTVDLLDAETALREAELRELSARYDVVLSTYKLHFAAGSSLVDLTEGTEGNP